MVATKPNTDSASSTPPPDQTKAIEADKLSLIALLARVPVGQLWAFIGILIGLVAGAFATAWTVRGIVEEVNIRSVTTSKEDLARRIEATEKELMGEKEDVRKLQEKDRFLSLYLRYVMARDNLDTSIPEANARKALDDYIEGRVDRERLIIHKGGGRLATVEFPDKTVWTLPRELHMVLRK